MKVIVVGAGIAGLSAAIGLRRAGHEVLILDKSSLSHEVGAAITVPPNASRIITSWGFDIKRARLVSATSNVMFTGDKLDQLLKMDLSNLGDKYGSGYYYSHRVDLHTELKLLATQVEGQGKPAVIHNRSAVVGYDTENGSVTLADGKIMTADLIVGADGIHSSAVKEVTGYENPAVPTGISAFRCLLPVKEIKDDPECAFLLEEMEGKLCSFLAPGKDHERIVWYPCRGNQVLNVGFVSFGREELKATEGWNTSVPTELFLNQLKDFHPALRHLLAKGKDVGLWSLRSRAPLPTWHRGKLILIGDAAHPMLPYHGQGGAQGIEDGCALGLLFSDLPDVTPETISNRLEAFENVRRNRASAAQILSSVGADEVAMVEELVRPFVEEGELPSNPAESFGYFYGHDVAKVCEKEMEKLKKS